MNPEIKAAQAILDADTAEIDARLDAREGWIGPRCQTGEPYVVYALGGLKPEGHASPLAPSAGDAMAAWKEQTAILRQPKAEGQRLYWRRRPMVMVHSGGADTGWSISARFCLTSAPELPADDTSDANEENRNHAA